MVQCALAVGIASGCGDRAYPIQPAAPASPLATPASPRLHPEAQPWVAAWPELQTRVPAYEISFPESTAVIVYDVTRGWEYAPGFFNPDGTVRAVELRQRGSGARDHPKHSWKVKLPDGQLFEGARRFNFLAEYVDSGYLSDMFSYRLMQAAGVQAPTPRFVNLTVNGHYEGIYTYLEEVDKRFLINHSIDDDANIYRCGERDCELKITPPAHYQAPFDKQTNEDQPWDDLNAFLWALSRTPEHEIEAYLERHLDLEPFLRYMAVNALIGMGGVDDSGSFLVHDRSRDKWIFVPWDLNNARLVFWRDWPANADPPVNDKPIPIYTAYDQSTIGTYEHKENKYGGAHRPWSVLNQRVWDRPALRNRALDYLEKLLDTVFAEQTAHAQVDAISSLIHDDLARDPWVSLPNAYAHPAFLKTYVTRRIAKLRQLIPAERHRGEGGVVINAIGAAGGAAMDEYGDRDAFIELYNREDQEIDLGGRVFTDDLRDEFKYHLPLGLRIPAKGKLVLWADGEPEEGPNHLPFTVNTAGGEFGLYTGEMAGVIDLTFHAPLQPGQVYARQPDGAETWGWR